MKILYLYDFEDWAIHNVGKMWLEDVPNVDVVYKKSANFVYEDLQKFDLVWFGYLDLFTDTYLTWDINRGEYRSKIVISVHDPLELYPQVEEWKKVKMKHVKFWDKDSRRLRQKIKALRYAKNIVVTSNEMKTVLNSYNLDPYLIPTASMLPARARNEIATTEPSILSVYQVFARKNIPLMDLIHGHCEDELDVRYDRKVGREVLPLEKYIELLDSHPIYVCTSFQEGGPIPAMDAMKRGAVVLTTPVGQVQDMIKNGVNGYICRSELEFLEVIKKLKNDPELLKSMRLRSLDTIMKTRDLDEIKKSVLKYLKQVAT